MLDPEIQHEAEIFLPAVVMPAFLHLIDPYRLTVTTLYHRVTVLDPGAEKEALPQLAEALFEDLLHHPPSSKFGPPLSPPRCICCRRTPAEVSGRRSFLRGRFFSPGICQSQCDIIGRIPAR